MLTSDQKIAIFDDVGLAPCEWTEAHWKIVELADAKARAEQHAEDVRLLRDGCVCGAADWLESYKP